MIHIVMMGPPGAGKGTQAGLIQNCIGIPQISTGDLFRYNLKNETELGVLAKSYMDKGELVPDDVTVNMVIDRLKASDCDNGAIFDGFPRSVGQAEALDALLSERGGKVDAVYLIDVDEDEVVRRLLLRGQIEGRADDNDETIRNRMRVYHEETAPVVNFYEARGQVVRINGQQSIVQVNADLLDKVRGLETSEKGLFGLAKEAISDMIGDS